MNDVPATSTTSPMPNLTIGRYTHPETHGWAGWIEPDNRDWIVFVGANGTVEAYLDRDEQGAILCPDCGTRTCGIGVPQEERETARIPEHLPRGSK